MRRILKSNRYIRKCVGLILILLFNKFKIELFAVEVCTHNTYAHRVTNSKLSAVATTHYTIVRIVELIIIILQCAHWNHTLALVLVDFGIEAPLGNTTYHSVVDLANVLAHELHLLVFDT